MALADSVTGDGILTASSKSSNVYGVSNGAFPVTYFKETNTTEVREWVALTEDAAETVKNANVQPPTGTYTYDVAEDNRVVDSYTLTRSYELKTLAPADPEQVVDVIYDPVAGPSAISPLDVTLSTETEGALITWWKSDIDGVTDPVEVPNITEVSVKVPGTIWAYAKLAGMDDSDNTSSTYTVP